MCTPAARRGRTLALPMAGRGPGSLAALEVPAGSSRRSRAPAGHWVAGSGSRRGRTPVEEGRRVEGRAGRSRIAGEGRLRMVDLRRADRRVAAVVDRSLLVVVGSAEDHNRRRRLRGIPDREILTLPNERESRLGRRAFILF